jgi:uroporphyrinogen III methyltransferase/synthase
MVVGDVVNLREELKWYEEKPMFGQRILLTREHSEGFETLEEMGAEIIQFPTVEIVSPETWDELDAAIGRISGYDWLIFTSGNGVKYFFRRLFEKDVDIRELRGLKICAIGKKTEDEVKKYGLKVDLVPEEFRAEGLIKAFMKSEGRMQRSEVKNQETGVRSKDEKEVTAGNGNLEEDPSLFAPHSSLLKGMRFLLPRAEVAREIFPEKVRELGGEIDVPAAYRAIRPELHGKRLRRFLREGKISVATFTSAATFHNFREIMGEEADEFLNHVAIAVIGPVTAAAVQKAGFRVEIMPGVATVEAIVEEIGRWAMGKRS